MMKKFLILMLVLGMASLASATMTLQVAGPGECILPDQGEVGQPPAPLQDDYYDPVDSELFLEVCECLWIGVHNDIEGIPGATQQWNGFLAIDVTTGPASGEWTDNWTQYKPPLVPGAPGNIYAGSMEDVYGDGSLLLNMWILTLSDGAGDHFNLIGVLDAKEFHCTELGDVTIILLDESMTPVDSIVIHQIPEPMTIALLGLGGLFLRRRK